MRKKFNSSLLIAGLCGGFLGSLAAGFLYAKHGTDWNPVIMTGVYFAILAFCICLAAGISECCTYHLKGGMWDSYNKRNAVLVLLMGIAACFFAGMMFQFIYGLGRKKAIDNQADDYLIMIDNSGSTSNTDPLNQRFSAVEDFIRQLDSDKKVMVSIFNDDSQVLLPLSQVNLETIDRLSKIFAQYESDGDTDIQNTLLDTLNQYPVDDGRNAMAILVSDGGSSVYLREIAEAYNERRISIFTVGYEQSGSKGRNVMSKISDSTGGAYFEIDEISKLKETFSKIIEYKPRRALLDYRYGVERTSLIYSILRVLFLALFGILIGIVVGFMLDSQDMVVQGMIVRIPVSLLAGILMEAGLRQYWSGNVLRMLMGILFSLLISWYTKPDYHVGSFSDIPLKNNDRSSLEKSFGKNTLSPKSFDKSAGIIDRKKRSL